MSARTRGLTRNVLAAVISLSCVSLHQERPDWGFIPVTLWLVLMAIVYGVSLWLYSQRGAE